MRNLKPYEQLNESIGSKGKMGFAMSITTWDREGCGAMMIMGVADTFYEFAAQIFEDMTGMDASEHGEESPDLLKDVYTFMEEYSRVTEINSEYVFWSGLEPKSNTYVYDSEPLQNPAKVMVKLEKYFTNSRLVMSKYPHGNEDDLSYIVNSVEKDPDKLELYDNDEQKKIMKDSNWDKKKKSALLKYMRIKGQF